MKQKIVSYLLIVLLVISVGVNIYTINQNIKYKSKLESARHYEIYEALVLVSNTLNTAGQHLSTPNIDTDILGRIITSIRYLSELSVFENYWELDMRLAEFASSIQEGKIDANTMNEIGNMLSDKAHMLNLRLYYETYEEGNFQEIDNIFGDIINAIEKELGTAGEL